MNMSHREAATLLAGLAHERRLKLVEVLVLVGERGMAAKEIARRLRISPSSLSFHLALLQRLGLIMKRPRGRSRLYALHQQRLIAVVDFLRANCCEQQRGRAPSTDRKAPLRWD